MGPEDVRPDEERDPRESAVLPGGKPLSDSRRWTEGVFELWSWGALAALTIASHPLPPRKISGTNFVNLASLFWGGLTSLSLFCPETAGEARPPWGEEKQPHQ